MEGFIIEVKINKEIQRYQESILFGLSLRQMVFALLAIGVAVGAYFGLKPLIGAAEVGWVCMLAAFPFAMCGFFTYNGIHVMLKSALKRAVQERLIPFNPAEFCIPPKITKPDLQVIPSERYQSYLHAAEQRGVLPMFYLELSTGLRKGEIAALLWSDYDAQTQTIHVTKQYLFYNGQGTVSPPKSSTSVRYVSIPDEAAKLLEQEHEKHPKNPYMFPSPVTGEMYHPDAIVKIHRKICKDIGLENVRFHDLRHSFATTALQCGVDVKTVSTMLGHSSAGFTLNVYTHSTSRMQQEAARTVGNAMPKMLER